MMRGFQRQIAALFLTIAMVPTAPVAEEITGQVTGQVIKVDAASGVTIALPDGVAVQAGDPVRILGDIPGVGPVAISTLWVVDSFDNGIVLASPEGPPTGSPQPGYSARIDTNVQMVPAGLMPSPESLSLYLAAQELVRDGEPAQAADLYRQSADMGHPGAMTALGVMYSFGRGVAQDDLRALAWQERAARAGEVRAMVRLGLIRAVGVGTPTDFDIAARWFAQAGDLGDPTAMLFMFLLYEDGKGVPKDFALSLEWLKRAADNGNVLAQYYLGEAYMDGEDGILPKDPTAGERYLLMAAKAGQSDAMDELSDYYQQRNPAESRRWSQAAQQAGDMRDYLQDPRCLAPDECYRAH